MASHIHLFKPGAAITFAASDAIVGGRAVAVSGDRTVATAVAGDAKFVGIAATDANTGSDVLVLRGGVQKLVASAAIAAGDRVALAADGKVIKAATGGIGIALTAAAEGGLAQIALD